MEDLYLYIIGAAYLTICICVAVEADARRHNGTTVFFFCLFCTPLIGAIMFTTYKEPEVIELAEAEETPVE